MIFCNSSGSTQRKEPIDRKHCSDVEDYRLWAYNKNITINTVGLGLSGNVVDFPLLVRLTSSNFNFNEAMTNGEDIRFANKNGMHLNYEVERWDKTNSLAEIWVRVDTVTQYSNTQYITMYWGNPSGISSSNGGEVFDVDNNYCGVWHLAASNYTDATLYGNNGSNERGRQLASRPYVYRLVAGNYAKARLMIVVR